MGHLRAPHEAGKETAQPILGTLDDIESVLHDRVVDEVAICLSPADWEYVEPITRICEEEGKVVRVSMRALGGVLGRGYIDEIGDTPIVTFLYGPDRLLGLALKRVADVALSAVMLVLLSPVWLAIAVYIRVREGSPILFRQQRVGLHGRLFTCLKFRTMVDGAEQLQDSVSHLNKVHGPAFKIDDDPRIMPSGRFLRRTGLDELPQLVNVLRGEIEHCRAAAGASTRGRGLQHLAPTTVDDAAGPDGLLAGRGAPRRRLRPSGAAGSPVHRSLVAVDGLQDHAQDDPGDHRRAGPLKRPATISSHE